MSKESSKTEIQKDKTGLKEQNIQNLWENFKWYNKCIMEIL